MLAQIVSISFKKFGPLLHVSGTPDQVNTIRFLLHVIVTTPPFFFDLR
jgi:hypothetical protein